MSGTPDDAGSPIPDLMGALRNSLEDARRDAGSPSAGTETCACNPGEYESCPRCQGRPYGYRPAVPSPEDTVEPEGHWANGHRWPCARFYSNSMPSDPCTCSATPPAVRTGEDDEDLIVALMVGVGPQMPPGRSWNLDAILDKLRPVVQARVAAALLRGVRDGADGVATINARPLVSGTANRDDELLTARVELSVALDQRDPDVIAEAAEKLLALLGDDQVDGCVTVRLPAEDVAFIRGFDADRDRTATRKDMVTVIEHLQAALAGQVDEVGEFPCGWCSGHDEHRPDCPSWVP